MRRGVDLPWPLSLTGRRAEAHMFMPLGHFDENVCLRSGDAYYIDAPEGGSPHHFDKWISDTDSFILNGAAEVGK